MSGRHFLADRDELSRVDFLNIVLMHLGRKGSGGGGGGRTESLDRAQDEGLSELRLKVRPAVQGIRKVPGLLPGSPQSAGPTGLRRHKEAEGLVPALKGLWPRCSGRHLKVP